MDSEPEVRDAFKSPVKLSRYSVLTILIWGALSVYLFTSLENILLAVFLSALGIPIFIFSFVTDHKRAGTKLSEYIRSLEGDFSCRQCSSKISSPLKHEDKDGVPIIFYCASCGILWYVGSHTRHT